MRKHSSSPTPDKLNLVVVNAHPDDICWVGGIAAKYSAMGHAVFSLSVTLGETVRPPGVEQTRVKRLRKAEGEDIARILGAKFSHLEVPCNKIIPTMAMKMLLVSSLRALKANIILFPTPWDVHADHRNLSWTMRDVVYYVGHAGIAADHPPCELRGAYMYDIEITDNELHEPDFVVDISAFAEIKFRSLLSKKRAAVFGDASGQAFLEQQRIWTQFWGMRHGVAHAEPLHQCYGSMLTTGVVKRLKVRNELPVHATQASRSAGKRP